MIPKSHQTPVETRRGDRRAYVSPEEFRAVFENEMDSLYSLALLLTGEHTVAEACFLSALDDCCAATNVFAGWALSWSRRAIVKDAIRRLNPAPPLDSHSVAPGQVPDATGIFARVLDLGAFERFVFAMAALERYSVHECAVLLSCSLHQVKQTRLQALRSLAVQEIGLVHLHGTLGAQTTLAASAA